MYFFGSHIVIFFFVFDNDSSGLKIVNVVSIIYNVMMKKKYVWLTIFIYSIRPVNRIAMD